MESPRHKAKHSGGSHQLDLGSTIGLSDIFRSLKRGKWLLVFSMITIIGAMGLYTALVEREYEAFSIVFFDPSPSPMDPVISFTQDNGNLLNELAILKNSLPLAEDVADQLLNMNADPNKEHELPIVFNKENELLDRTALAVRLIAPKSGRVKFEPVDESVSLVRIRVISSNPNEAALVSNLYANEYQLRNQETSRASITAAREFLADQEVKRKQELDSLEVQLRLFMEREEVVSLSQEGSFLVNQVAVLDSDYEDSRVQLELERASLQATNDALERVEPGLADRIASGIELRIGSLQNRIAQLELDAETYYSKNPEVSREDLQIEALDVIHRNIDSARQDLTRLSNEYVDDLFRRGVSTAEPGSQGLTYISGLQEAAIQRTIIIKGLEAKQAALAVRISEYEVDLAELPSKSIQFAQLQRAASSTEQTYLSILDRLQSARVAEEGELGSVEIIRRALVPFKPVRPDVLQNMLLAFLASIIVGFGLAFFKQALDTRVHTIDDVKQFGLNVLGAVPRFDQLLKKESGKGAIKIGDRTISPDLVALTSPLAPISETYRGLHTSLQFSLPDAIVQTILVTSSIPSEGKTVTSSNLAVTIARTGRKTLYVDTDLRKPKGHGKFGLHREPGLVEMLFADNEPEFEKAFTGIDNLYVLTAGKSIHNPSEMIGSQRMRDLISHMKRSFDIIIFDSPPLLAATDGLLLATQCDAVALVIASEKAERDSVERTVELLNDVGAPLAGTILNFFQDENAAGYGYTYGYGYGAGYGDSGMLNKGTGTAPHNDSASSRMFRKES